MACEINNSDRNNQWASKWTEILNNLQWYGGMLLGGSGLGCQCCSLRHLYVNKWESPGLTFWPLPLLPPWMTSHGPWSLTCLTKACSCLLVAHGLNAKGHYPHDQSTVCLFSALMYLNNRLCGWFSASSLRTLRGHAASSIDGSTEGWWDVHKN